MYRTHESNYATERKQMKRETAQSSELQLCDQNQAKVTIELTKNKELKKTGNREQYP